MILTYALLHILYWYREQFEKYLRCSEILSNLCERWSQKKPWNDNFWISINQSIVSLFAET